MATTIRSTELDFFAIKNNLKRFLLEKEEFNDYNFEASGLSNILDVLAYNTHYNALIANFATNESYLTTAQLRESVVSLANSIGYIPGSRNAAEATVQIKLKLSLTDTANQTRPNTLSIPAFTRFKTEIDQVTFTFQNIETLIATDNNGVYDFRPESDENANPILFEGLRQEKSFIVGTDPEQTVYVVPDANMDTDTAVVRVFESPSSSAFTVYEDLKKATVVSEDSPLFILSEAPNGFYELTFGVGTTLGATPIAGNKISVEYLRTAGPEGNGALNFSPVNEITFENVLGASNLTVTTVSKSAGGSEKQNLESIRRNAPFQYASQNRMVTSIDYSALITKNYSSVIKDIITFGGEDAVEPEYGTVFTSIIFKDGISNATKNATKVKVEQLANQLGLVSFDLKFLSPEETYISTQTTFEFNPTLTGLSQSSVVKNVKSRSQQYFNENTGRFGQDFRRSNLLTLIDDLDPSILSSRSEIKIQKRISPVFGTPRNYTVKFPVPIENPSLAYRTNLTDSPIVEFQSAPSVDTPSATVFSNFFIYNGRVVQLRNSLNREERIIENGVPTDRFQIVASTNLEIYDVNAGTSIVSSVGSYDPSTGVVSIVGLEVDSIVGAKSFIKIFARPANQSLIDVSLNNLIVYDAEESSARALVNIEE